MFNCRLNQKYKRALKPKLSEKIKQTIANELGYNTVKEMVDGNFDYINTYVDQILDSRGDYWGDHADNGIAYLQCCGLSELVTGDEIDKDTPLNRYILARKIRYDRQPNSVFIVGLPLEKVGVGSSDYSFKNYRVIRKILLDFGMKQVTPKTYVNVNSNNKLSVLVGQMPR